MSSQRISVKYFLAEPAAIDLGLCVPVFHQWIQQSKVPGMLIDVADYRHVLSGPGVMLVGHEVDYALDMADGRPGLLHTRKRSSGGSLTERLAATFRDALHAARMLEQEERFQPRLRFRTDEAVLILPDRLHAPNTDGGFERLRPELEAFLASIYNVASIGIQREAQDPRRCLTLRITANGAPDLRTLMERL